MNVGQNMLPMFLKTAESLQVRGLTENNTLNPKVSNVKRIIDRSGFSMKINK